jgi:hypothetical protein
MRYFKELVPMLVEFQRERQKPLVMFFEIKSNLKLPQLFQLAGAGILALQPGIESFSDHILSLMDKGANALQQLNFIKWANQVGVRCTYNILLRNPGETVEDYREMLEMLPSLRHLQPPHGIADMQLQRYSPYFLRPEKFELKNVQPKRHYRNMFPDERVDVENLVYEFDFDHDELDQPELVEARREFTKGLLEWKVSYEPRQLIYYMVDGNVCIRDKRSGDEKIYILEGTSSRLFVYLDQVRSFNNIERAFPEISASVLRYHLRNMTRLRILYHHANGCFVALPIRIYERDEYYVELERTLALLPSAASVEKKETRKLVVFPVLA